MTYCWEDTRTRCSPWSEFTGLPTGPVFTVFISTCCYVLMRDERRKEERSKQGQTNNKAKQHSTPKAVTFPKKNELPQVGLEPTTLYTLDRALYHYVQHGIVILLYS